MADKKPKKTTAQKLIEIGNNMFHVRRNFNGLVVGIPKDGPRIARPMKGQDSVRQALIRAYFERYGSPPTPSAVDAALSVLEAYAGDLPPVNTPLRVLRTGDHLVIDLGDPAGRVVAVGDGKWRLVEEAPDDICFWRTNITGALPRPDRRGADVDLLRKVVNVTDEDWPLVVAWLVCALLDVTTPILALTGQQGSGKSFAGKVLVNTVDPSAVGLRAMPHKADDWAVTAAGSHAFGLDNVSRIRADMSDALCRAVTGDAVAKRTLYSDADIHALQYRRAILMTSIDPGSMQGDLGERLIPVELGRINGQRRRLEGGKVGLQAEAKRIAPRVFGGLLDLAAYVLANPVDLRNKPRMADAAQVMATLDKMRGTDTVGAYRRSQAAVLTTVLDSDPVSAAVVAFMRDRQRWQGTATELHNALWSHTSSTTNWPANARGLSERVKRIAPALRDAHGIILTRTRGSSERKIVLKHVDGGRRERSGPRVKAHAG